MVLQASDLYQKNHMWVKLNPSLVWEPGCVMLREKLRKQRHPIKNSFKIPDDIQKHHQDTHSWLKRKDPRNRPTTEPTGKRRRVKMWSHSHPWSSCWDSVDACAQDYAVGILGANKGPARDRCPLKALVCSHQTFSCKCKCPPPGILRWFSVPTEELGLCTFLLTPLTLTVVQAYGW